VAGIVVAASLFGAAVAPVRAAPQTPESRLLTVWLDLSLLGIFYPDTTAKTFLPNLRKIARQLNQTLPRLHFGEAPRDSFRFRSGAVVIKRHPPKSTWILYTRARNSVWMLVDGPAGAMRITRVAVKK
jgi:hypothetical protein